MDKIKRFEVGHEMLEIQGRDGTFNYSSYDQGLYNGMEFMLSMIEGREPKFRNPPTKWLQEPKWKKVLRKVFNRPKYVVTCQSE